jgi:hypothetical protein
MQILCIILYNSKQQVDITMSLYVAFDLNTSSNKTLMSHYRM